MIKGHRISTFILFALLWVQPATAQDTGPEKIAGTPFEKREVIDSLGREVVYYINKPESPAPLLLMIQGSGCARIINIQSGGAYSTLFNLLPFAHEGQFTVMAVEKPSSGFAQESSGNNSGSPSCTPEFYESFTAESWLIALQASLNDARKLSWVDKQRALVFGHSEGAVMAAMLAESDAGITDVISLAGTGTTQLFDFLALAYQRCPDATPCIDAVHEQYNDIQTDPQSASKFAWGHPYKRWTSFFGVDPAELLKQSDARVYMAFGMADNSVPALSQELMVAKLLTAGKNLTVRRVPNADHALMNVNAPSFEDMDKEYRAALQWFFDIDQ